MIEITRNWSVADIRQVDLRIGLGDIKAVANGGGQITLRAQLRSNDENDLETAVADGVLTIKTRSDEGWLGRNNRIDVTLAVPRDASVALTVKTGQGDVYAEGVSGIQTILTGKGDVHAAGGNSSLTVKTGKGDIFLREWRGDVQLTTGKGDASVSDLAGGLQMTTGAGDTKVVRWQANGSGAHQIKTGSGDIAVSQVQAGSLTLSTGRGDCTLQQATVRALNAKTGLGSVTLTGDPAGGNWEGRSGKGDLALTLPTTAAARVEAATGHGSIHSDLPQVKVARPGPASPRGGRTIFVLGEEQRSEVRLSTGYGDISVRMVALAPVTAAPPPTKVTVEAPSAVHPVAVQPMAPAVPDVAAVPPAPPVPPAPTAPQMTAMSVLESLARGEISVDEAEALLRSLEQ